MLIYIPGLYAVSVKHLGFVTGLISAEI